jgi:HEAT repeat protein
MKTPSRLAWLVALTCALLGSLTACKEKAPQVNISANVQDLKSPETDKKVNACIELAKGGPAAAAAVPDLIPLLKDKDSLVRHLAAYALGQIGPKASSAVPALKDALKDSDTQVVSDALNALRFIGDTNANIAVPNVMTAPSQ